MANDSKYANTKIRNREMRRENLREELKSKHYISGIHKIIEIENWEDRVQEYNGKLTAYFKLLNKTLPDVKAIELEGELKVTPNLIMNLGDDKDE